MNLIPLNDRIIVETIEETANPSSLIILPDSAKEKPQLGRVLAVGPQADDMVEEGNKILFGKYSGQEVTIEGKKVLIMRIDEVLAVVK